MVIFVTIAVATILGILAVGTYLAFVLGLGLGFNFKQWLNSRGKINRKG